MLPSLLIGFVGGQRAMTPLAAVSLAAVLDALPNDNGAPRLLARPLVAVAALVLAIGELAGDKQKTAPDRIVPIGLLARATTSAIAGAALAPRSRRSGGALLGAATAVVASYPGWRARVAVMPRYGQTPSGVAEDAIVISAAAGVLALARRTGRR